MSYVAEKIVEVDQAAFQNADAVLAFAATTMPSYSKTNSEAVAVLCAAIARHIIKITANRKPPHTNAEKLLDDIDRGFNFADGLLASYVKQFALAQFPLLGIDDRETPIQ